MSAQKINIKYGNLSLDTAKIVAAVENAISLKLMRAEGNTFYLFKSIFPSAKKAQEIYIKNLFIYALVKQEIEQNDAIFIKDIETGSRISFYKNKKAIIE